MEIGNPKKRRTLDLPQITMSLVDVGTIVFVFLEAKTLNRFLSLCVLEGCLCRRTS